MPHDLAGTFAAGLLTFLSPCVLPLVPIYLGLLAGASVAEIRQGRRPARLVLTAAAFALGLAAVFVALGLAATAVSRTLSEHRTLLLRVGGGAVAAMGLRQLGVLRLPLLERERRPLLARLRGGGSLLGAFAFGAAFALGWTPCVGPVLGAVLTWAASASSTPAGGALLLGAYAAGLGVPLVAAAAVAPRALPLLDRVKPHLRAIELATGLVLVAAGTLLVADRLSWLSPRIPSSGAEGPVAVTAGDAAASCSAVPGSPPATCSVPAQPAPAPAADPGAALARALRPAGPAVVEVVSDRCPACARMAPVVAAARGRCAGKALRVETLRVESAEGAAVARRHAIRGVPSVLLLDASGAEVGRLVGEQPLAALEQAMLDLTGGRCVKDGAPAGS